MRYTNYEEKQMLLDNMHAAMDDIPPETRGKIPNLFREGYFPVFGNISYKIKPFGNSDFLGKRINSDIEIYLVDDNCNAYKKICDLLNSRFVSFAWSFKKTSGKNSTIFDHKEKILKWEIFWLPVCFLSAIHSFNASIVMDTLNSNTEIQPNVKSARRTVYPHIQTIDKEFSLDLRDEEVGLANITPHGVVIYQTKDGVRIYNHRKRAIEETHDFIGLKIRDAMWLNELSIPLFHSTRELMKLLCQHPHLYYQIRLNLTALNCLWIDGSYLTGSFASSSTSIKRITYRDLESTTPNTPVELITLNPHRIIIKD